MIEVITFALAGFATGLFSGALGVGGALLATPLVRFLGLPPYLAVGTTVPVMLPTTLTGAYTYYRAGLVDIRAAVMTAVPGAAAAVLGALATRSVDGHLLMLVTAGVLGVMAIRLLQDRPSPEVSARRRNVGLVMVGLISGFTSGLLGIGGGFIMVPAFIRFFAFPIKLALGTSLAVITMTVIPNIAAQAYVGNIDWLAALMLSVGVIPGARLGARVSIAASEKRLRMVVSIALIAVSLFFGFVELRELLR